MKGILARKKNVKRRKAAAESGAEKKSKQKKPRLILRILQRAAIAAAIIGCTVLIISVQSNIAEKQAELQTIQEQIDAYEAENEDLTRILNSGDTDRYMEKLAREDYGYAYPDEFRFYDTSRN